MADDTESGGDERIGIYAEAVAGAVVAAAAKGGGAGPLVGVRRDDPDVAGAPRWSSEATAVAARAGNVICRRLTHLFLDVPDEDAATARGLWNVLRSVLTLEAILQRHGALLQRRGERVVSGEAAQSSPRDTTAE
jgi:hypothetical protein